METQTSFQDIKDLFAATAAQTQELKQEAQLRQEEIQREMLKTQRQMQETTRQMQEQKQEAQRQEQELRQQSRETGLLVQQGEKRFAKLEELFTGQWGKLMESLVEGGLIRLFNQRGITVEQTQTRVKGCRNGQNYEFDVIAENGDDIVIVEVKTTLRPDDVKHFVSKLAQAKSWLPGYRDKTVYGALAWLSAQAGAERMAENKGLYSIRATGDSAHIVNAADFQPKRF